MQHLNKTSIIYFLAGLVLSSFVFVGVFLYTKNFSFKEQKNTQPDVTIPTISNGELLLPKVSAQQVGSNLNKNISSQKIVVMSANLVGVFDREKLTGIRVVGEITNIGDGFVTAAGSVVRFIDAKGTVVGQKVGRFSTNFDFRDIAPQDKALYDVTVDEPPASDRVEVVFNTLNSSSSAVYSNLKIANRELEKKTTAVNQGSTESATQKVEYYAVSGRVVNPFSNPVSEISIYAWAKNELGQVFALGRTDFKNDLLNPGKEIDFKVIMLPIKNDQKFSSYEIAAWGREYKLSF